MAEKNERKSWYEQILSKTEGMSQEQRWDYYDKHPGTHEVVWEFRHQNVTSEIVGDFNSAAKALGVKVEVEQIDKATESLDADGYLRWLDEHPSAKTTLQKIREVMDKKK